jgi:hypothetical protein
VAGLNLFRGLEVGDGAADFEHAAVGAGAQSSYAVRLDHNNKQWTRDPQRCPGSAHSKNCETDAASGGRELAVVGQQ